MYDIHIETNAAVALFGSKFYTFGPGASVGVFGAQKLANVFAKYLLTAVGSDPLDPFAGTGLASLVGSNITPLDAQEVLQFSIEKAVKDIQTFQRGRGMPDTERLTSATVTQFLFLPEGPGISAQIYIQNAAGKGLSFLLPALATRV